MGDMQVVIKFTDILNFIFNQERNVFIIYFRKLLL